MFARLSMFLSIVFGVLAVALVDFDAAPRANLAYTLEDMSGNKVNLESYAGRPIIINLWATWCGPCRKETPDLEALSQKYRDSGLQIIGISTDDKPDAIRKFADEMKVTYPMLVGLGQEAFLQSLGFEEVLPFSVLIKANGRVSESFKGILPSIEAWERKIAKLF